MAMTFDNIRVGQKYYLINYGEKSEFFVQKRISEKNYLLKDANTLEEYTLDELIQYGKGKDFDFYEV